MSRFAKADSDKETKEEQVGDLRKTVEFLIMLPLLLWKCYCSVDVFTILKCRKEKEKVEPAAEGSKTKGLKKQVRPSPPMTRRNSEDKVEVFLV